MRGRTLDVGGMFSATSIINTVIERRVVIPIVTFSPENILEYFYRHKTVGVANHMNIAKLKGLNVSFTKNIS